MLKYRFNQIFIVAELAMLCLSVFPELYLTLAYLVFLIGVLRMMYKIGNGSFFLELLYVYTSFTCLLMPTIGYQVFTPSNRIARMWVRYMPVQQETYFSFVLPAVLVMGLTFFLFRENSSDEKDVVDTIVKDLKRDVVRIRPEAIFALIGVSLGAYTATSFMPDSLRQVGTFLYYSFFASMFYVVFYKNFPYKRFLIPAFAAFILVDALRSGMFTIIAYMGGLFMILLLAGRRVSIPTKTFILVGAVIFVFFIQLFKLDLRRTRKRGMDTPSTEIAARVITNASNAKFDEVLFPLYYRMNQGFNIAIVQRRIPSRADYVGGEVLFINFLSSFVPRLFWPDKPEAGGKANMKVYAGVDITTWSTNVGPIGEAYGSFGNFGGWVYICLFSIFLRTVYLKYIALCRKNPIFFIWLPSLFFQSLYVTESDSLQAFNSLVKGMAFLFAMYKLFPALFPLGADRDKPVGVIGKRAPGNPKLAGA